MERIRLVSLAALLTVLPYYSLAATFDGSNPFLCAVRNILECSEGTGCERVTAEDINAPSFFRFDFESQTIRGVRADRSERLSKMKRMERLDKTLFVQGVEDGIENVRDGLGWSVAIQEDSGRMVLTASGDDVAFVVFGACTTLD